MLGPAMLLLSNGIHRTRRSTNISVIAITCGYLNGTSVAQCWILQQVQEQATDLIAYSIQHFDASRDERSVLN
jgi:hypothetical protein